VLPTTGFLDPPAGRLYASPRLTSTPANFIVKGPNGQEKAYPMVTAVVTIGRSDRCDIAVKDASMSGRHAEISRIDGEIRVKDLGSANGIWLNGERVEEVELFDGDVLRCGQTSIRVNLAGGAKRPETRLHSRLVTGVVAAIIGLVAAFVVLGVALKKHAQRRRDLTLVASFVEAAREAQAANPCAAAADEVAEADRTLQTLGHPTCASRPKRDDAQQLGGAYRKLAQQYETIARSASAFVTRTHGGGGALNGIADQIADPDLKGRVLEALDTVVDQRAQVTGSFISDWRRLAQATDGYGISIEEAFVHGKDAACARVDAGIVASTPREIVAACNTRMQAARTVTDEKLKDLDAGAPAAHKE
jgi:hypothetical protein